MTNLPNASPKKSSPGKAPRPRRTLLRLVLALLSIVLLATIGWYAFQRYLANPLPIQRNIIVEVTPGSSLQQVANDLHDRDLLPLPEVFALWARFEGLASSIRTGEYELTPGTTPRSLLALLISGRNKQYPLTLVEGWTMAQALQAIWQSEKIEPTLQDAGKEEIQAVLGDTVPFLEGSIFPDTYYYTKGTTDRAILVRARQRLVDVLSQEWEARAEGLPYAAPHEALIMASVVEKESGLQAEQARIAGVFVRRLQQNMRLQSDPTVIYGVGEAYTGVIRRSDLDADNPWNTYRQSGLPPTPIALAGRAAIHASLQPEHAPYLYFVASGDGGHQFSATLEEHNAAVQRYRQQLQGSSASDPSSTGTSDGRP